MFDCEWDRERIDRHVLAASVIPFGVSYLDDALIGILPNELMIIGARTGRGKTELATNIAYQASKKMRKVAFFALEADKWEIQRRLKYRKLVQMVRENYAGQIEVPRFREWVTRGIDEDWERIEKILEQELILDTSELKIIYKNEKYTAEDFVEDFEGMEKDFDLFIVDHLHYFDSDERNESEGLKKAIHVIRNAAIYHGKPVILLAHLRKGDRNSQKTMPDLEDFHGHSDIVKVATTVLLLSPVPPDKIEGDVGSYPTYFHIAKCRTAGEVLPYAGMLGFDFRTNNYREKYFLQKAFLMKDPEPLLAHEIPKWAIHAIRPRVIMGSGGAKQNGRPYKED